MTRFHQISLNFDKNLFEDLKNSTNFEPTGKGRIGNHLVKIQDQKVPIVRTTTQYGIPAQTFSAIHDAIIAQINTKIQDTAAAHLPLMDFNNALIEVYDKSYSKMNFHSDQCLDLEPKSYIGLFSCYENPNELSAHNLRSLIVKEKGMEEAFEITLVHNSVVLFSVDTNHTFLHKIILKNNQNPSVADNRWLGITFRKSKTWIQFKNNVPYFLDGEMLELANDAQKSEFFKVRGQENSALDFIYPKISYTISLGDTLNPIDSPRT